MKSKSQYQIASSVTDDILEIILTGEESVHTMENMKNDIDNIIIKNNVKNVLIDCRALEGRLGIAETYERVRSYPPDVYRIKMAIVDIPEYAGYQKFHEDTSINAGLTMKWFTSVDAAMIWLKNI
jgi:hypothetical protein